MEKREWKRVREWDKVKLNHGYQKVEIDLTPYIQKPGNYKIEIRLKDAVNSEIGIKEPMVLVAGAGVPDCFYKLSPDIWVVSRTAQVTPDESGKTILSMMIKAVILGYEIKQVDGKDAWVTKDIIQSEMYIQ